MPTFETPPAEATDHEIAQGIRDGKFASPTKMGAFWLFDVRVTGTGMAYRESLGEWAHRDPESWLSTNFVERCNGLAVIWVHPDPGQSLDTKKFREDAVGSIVLPYVKGDEVWGIAKIYDEPAAEAMQNAPMSTSPGVTPPQGAKAIPLESGHKVLDEPLPRILDHLAICELGVWDKGGPPEGVRLDALDRKDETVTEEEKKALEKERDDANARADAAEKEMADAKTRADSAEKERDDAKGKLDAMPALDDKARKDAEMAEAKENADKAKRDSRKDAHAKHDGVDKGDVLDCAKCDAAEAEEEAEREDKKRKDTAKEAEPDANRGMDDIKDSVTIKAMQAQIDQLTRAAAPLSITDRDELAKAHARYDSLFQALLQPTPMNMGGETPINYRKRCANALRPFTKGFKEYAFHDSQQVKDFELVENAIFDEATAYAKNPPAEAFAGVVREIHDTTTEFGKRTIRFEGDQDAVWAPFKPPVRRFLSGIKTPQSRARRRTQERPRKHGKSVSSRRELRKIRFCSRAMASLPVRSSTTRRCGMRSKAASWRTRRRRRFTAVCRSRSR